MKKKMWMAFVVGCLLAPVVPASASRPIIRYECFGKTTRLSKPDRRGVIRGTPRNDVIVVLRRDVIVLGGDGHDRICTGRGDDYVAGGEGHDRIRSGRGRDDLNGGGGLDYLNGAAGRDDLEGGFGGSDTLVGGHGDDRLRGGDEGGGNYIFGGRGTDQIVGGKGAIDDDYLVGGDGSDHIEGGAGSDTVSFASSDVAVQIDLSTGASSEDTLIGIENVDGSAFDDVLTGGILSNRFDGGDGSDFLVGGAGGDHMDGGRGADSLDGGEGDDFISFFGSPGGVAAGLDAGSGTGEATDTFTGFENLIGSAYDDELTGDAAANDILGSRGADALFGLEGDDNLTSGSSGDAGAGTDTCWDSGGAIENCEQELHGDPPAFSMITGPTEASTIEVDRFKEVTGTASAGAFGPEPHRVQIALRRLTGSGCYWWDARHAVMQPGHCERPLWVVVDFHDGQGTWSRRVPGSAQILNAGDYQVRSRIHQPGYREQAFTSSHNLVEFRLQ